MTAEGFAHAVLVAATCYVVAYGIAWAVVALLDRLGLVYRRHRP